MDNLKSVIAIAEELATAHNNFYEELVIISTKYDIPIRELVEMAINVMEEVDLDGTDNS